MQAQISKILIKKQKKQTVFLFDKPKRNRPLTPWERQQEKEDAKIWMRPERHYLYDKPTYNLFPPTPLVNFHLGYKP